MRGVDLRRIREALALSHVDISVALGVHPFTLAKWEAERHRIPEPAAKMIEVLQKIRRRRQDHVDPPDPRV
jgi:DNA-binding transcriptional regulator YiaG